MKFNQSRSRVIGTKRLTTDYAPLIYILLFTVFLAVSVYADAAFILVNATIDTVSKEVDFSTMPNWLRWLTRANFALQAGSGLYFALRARREKILRNMLVVYWLGLSWSLFLLFFRTTSIISVITSYSVGDLFAPATLCMAGVFFLGASARDRSRLQSYLCNLIIAMGFAVIVLGLVVEAGSRDSARRFLNQLSDCLVVTSCIPLLSDLPRRKIWLQYLPIFAILMDGIVIQTRSVFILTFVQVLVAYIILRKRFGRFVLEPRIRWKSITALVVGVGVCGAGAATYFLSQSASLSAFEQRLGDDTRSDQAAIFFHDHPVATMLWGSGFPTGDEYVPYGIEGIDSGYIDILYIGGLPALYFAVCFFSYPSWALLLESRVSNPGIACAAFAGSISFLSSEVFKIYPADVLLCLIGGMAYRSLLDSRENGRRHRSSVRAIRLLATRPSVFTL